MIQSEVIRLTDNSVYTVVDRTLGYLTLNLHVYYVEVTTSGVPNYGLHPPSHRTPYSIMDFVMVQGQLSQKTVRRLGPKMGYSTLKGLTQGVLHSQNLLHFKEHFFFFLDTLSTSI